jgi:Cu(I)/Ag(I) efflux system membrane fusion protein
MGNRKRLWLFILLTLGAVLLLAPFSYWWLASPTLTAEQAGKEVEGSHPMPEQQPSGQEAGKTAPEGPQHGSGDGASSAAPQRAPIQLSPAQQQLIGVTYGTVEKRPLTRVIRTVGRVEYDERKLAEVTLKIAGWIQDLYADYTGKLVKKGQPLFTLYSPDLVTAQEEYLLALRTRAQLQNSSIPGARESAESLVRVSRNRMLLWDLTATQIRALEEASQPQIYQTIYSPLSGFIIEKTAFKGHRVEPGMTLYKIADLSTVWVYADIYEYELPFVHVGQEAKISLSYYPGKVFTATVAYLYPYLDEQTRTGRVRFELANTPDWTLKPAMYATAELEANLGEKLVIPDSAVLDSGVRQVVFVDKGDGHFAPQEVQLGSRVDHTVEVLAGLTVGERVVTSGNFLIDSESKLQAAESMMGMMGAIGMGDWKMESAKPMEMGGSMVAAAGPQEKTVGNLKLRMSTAPEPAKSGDNTLRIEVTDAQGQPVPDATVALEYTMDMPGMMIDKAQASHTRGGVYEAKVKFTMAGPWGVTVSVQRPGQAAVRERFTVNASQ